jgi:hypothetical protein
MAENPFQSPRADLPRLALWRRIVSILLLTSASLAAALAAVMAIAGTRWWVFVDRSRWPSVQPLFGVEFHLYQALYLGAGSLAIFAVVTWRIGRAIRRR